MTLQKITPLVLLMFTLVYALPDAVIPSAIAQEEDGDDMSLDEAENLASDTVSNVLDNDNTAGDNTNTQVSVPITDQDQTDANFGLSEALDVNVERTLTPPEEEEPPEFEAFCYEFVPIPGLHCYDTLEECQVGNVLFEEGFGVDNPDCEGVETVPPGAFDCEVRRNEAGEPLFAICFPEPP